MTEKGGGRERRDGAGVSDQVDCDWAGELGDDQLQALSSKTDRIGQKVRIEKVEVSFSVTVPPSGWRSNVHSPALRGLHVGLPPNLCQGGLELAQDS